MEYSSQQPPNGPINHPPQPHTNQEPIIPSQKKRRDPKKIFLVSAIIAVAAIFFYGGLKILGSNKSTDEQQSQNTNEAINAPVSQASKDLPDATKTIEYQNGFLGVKLSHPDNWTALESENKDSVRIESPNFSYKTLDQRNITGNFRIYIRKGARDVDGKYIGRAYAIQPSEKLVYTKPALGQRNETNLTLFGLDTPDNFALFLIAGNYSLNKGDTLGPNYGKEAETFIIAGGFSSTDLKDDLGTNMVDPELLRSSNAYKQALEILRSLQLR